MKIVIHTILFIVGFIVGTKLINMATASEIINCQYNFGNSSYSTGNVLKKPQIHKSFEMDGLKYEVHVENVAKPSQVDDYIVIENAKGHKITYALECK